MNGEDKELAQKVADCLAQMKVPVALLWHNDRIGYPDDHQMDENQPDVDWLPAVRACENVGPMLALLETFPVRHFQLSLGDDGWKAYCRSSSEQMWYIDEHPGIALTKLWLHLQRGQGRWSGELTGKGP